MSLFDVLENRMKSLFEGRNSSVPIPFKRLAKKATREMKAKAVKQNGETIAPTLYTVVVSPADDVVIAPLYQQVTNELVDFLSHEAQAAGYSVPATPIVRFIADAKIPNGRLDVIADVVTPSDLETLRREEAEYTKTLVAKGVVPPAAPNKVAGVKPLGKQRPMAAVQQPLPAEPVAEKPMSPVAAAQPAQSQAGTSALVDAMSGKRYYVGTDITVIGRDESMADLTLPDTNVSRRHAQIKRTAQGWVISDLGSTNGTKVNGTRITSEQPLEDGDTVQMGLITLTFKEK